MKLLEMSFFLTLVFTLILISGLAVLGLFIVQKVIKVKTLENEGIRIGTTIVSIIGALYGLVLALMVINLWKDYVELSAKTVVVATQIDILYREAGNLESEQKNQLRSLIKEYLSIIITESWPKMQEGIESNIALEHYNKLDFYVLGLTDKDITRGEETVLGDLSSGLNELSMLRKERLLYASISRIPESMWYIIVIGAILAISCTYFLKVGSFRLQIIYTIMHSSMIGVVIFVIIALNFPFKGAIKIEPYAFKKTLELISDKKRNMYTKLIQ